MTRIADAPRVVLLDAGGANFGSLAAAFTRLGAETRVSADPGRVAEATHLVLPGVGAAGAAMRRLRANRLDELIPRTTQPLLGICLGMQLLYEASEEGDTSCLGLIPGRVRRMRRVAGRRLPHMGWNRLQARAGSGFGGTLDGEYAYFVHGYAAAADSDEVVAQSTHGESFAALVQRGRICGAQFHPERSARAGARLLREFLEQRA
jgi:glutamine amidotransferase